MRRHSMNLPLHRRCTWVLFTSCTLKLTTHTAPELKWLLVERGTLAGELDKLQGQHSLLAAEIARVQDTLQAFDTTIRLTRTRTQTTRTHLAKLLANLNDELAFLDDLMVKNLELAEALAGRRDELRQNRTALQATLKQFDGAIAVEEIGLAEDWARSYGGRRSRALVSRYGAAHFLEELPE